MSVNLKKAGRFVVDITVALILGGVSGLVMGFLGYPKYGVFLSMIVVTGYMLHRHRRTDEK